MAQQVLFIHSSGSQDGGQGSTGLLDHLREGLGPGCRILAPAMPDSENPQYDRWRSALVDLFPGLDAPVLLVGHSLGGSVLLKFLSEDAVEVPIAGLFVIAAPYWGADGGWNVGEFELREGYAAKLKGLSHLFLYHSEDDEVVPFEHLSRYASELPNATVRRLKGCGHTYESGATAIVDDLRELEA